MKRRIAKKKVSAVSTVSKIVAIVSDIHFNSHHVPTWLAFKRWAKEVRPAKLVVLGDFVDLGMMSTYPQGADDEYEVIPQIRTFVNEIQELSEYCTEIIVVEGNHDLRYSKLLLGPLAQKLKGAIGLTLEEQCRFQGLPKTVKWIVEDTEVRGVKCGPFLLRHGHNQAGKFGQKHIAANRLMRTMGESEVVGHHHRLQLMCQTAGGRTAVSVANPCMTGDHAYSLDPNWQRGFTVLELYGPDNAYATPHPILITDGHFAWNGKVYDGNV